MFGIGFSEILIIAFVIILFIKPEDIPKVFRFLGNIAGKAKAAYNEVVSIKDQIINEIDTAADFVEPTETDNSGKPNESETAKAIQDLEQSDSPPV